MSEPHRPLKPVTGIALRIQEWRYRSAILNLGTRCIWSGQLHSPFALATRKEPPLQYPLHRRLVAPQGLSGCHGEEKNYVRAGNWTPAIQSVPVALPTELSPTRFNEQLDVSLLICSVIVKIVSFLSRMFLNLLYQCIFLCSVLASNLVIIIIIVVITVNVVVVQINFVLESKLKKNIYLATSRDHWRLTC
jgi:hypothetical protein